jgi:hypothetical protein
MYLEELLIPVLVKSPLLSTTTRAVDPEPWPPICAAVVVVDVLNSNLPAFADAVAGAL